jgi:SAM-dependent methyltransferase
MKPALLTIITVGSILTGCTSYRMTPEKTIERQARFLDTRIEDTLLDFSMDQPLRVAVTAANKNTGCIYLGYAPRTKRRQVYVSTTKRLFDSYNRERKFPKSTAFAAIGQHGDSLELDNESISHILIDDNIYRFNDFNFAVSEFRRVLKERGRLMLRLVEFSKVIEPKRQLAFKNKPMGTTKTIKEYFEQRGFKLLETHTIVLSKPMARATREKELVFLFAKV